tara:strand:+ start:279 stop:524 length:246 start_codon:yes stop_codon:yes gene_type:complete
MGKRNSILKKIFEDQSLSDQQKYRKINYLLNNKIFSGIGSRFWSIAIGLNVIFWPFFIITPNVETDSPNLSQIATFKDRKN